MAAVIIGFHKLHFPCGRAPFLLVDRQIGCMEYFLLNASGFSTSLIMRSPLLRRYGEAIVLMLGGMGVEAISFGYNI